MIRRAGGLGWSSREAAQAASSRQSAIGNASRDYRFAGSFSFELRED
jgi:hypothetical protein